MAFVNIEEVKAQVEKLASRGELIGETMDRLGLGDDDCKEWFYFTGLGMRTFGLPRLVDATELVALVGIAVELGVCLGYLVANEQVLDGVMV